VQRVSRYLCAAALNPDIGIHHHSQYNHFALACGNAGYSNAMDRRMIFVFAVVFFKNGDMLMGILIGMPVFITDLRT